MISSSRNFLFIHIPKTGGNSLQNVLRDYSEDEVVSREPHQDGSERFELQNRRTGTTKHSTLMEYRQVLPADEYQRLFKFCCVRNPWDRAISFYFSPHRGVTTFERSTFIDFIKTIPPALNYLRESEEQGLPEAVKNMNRIIRFERLHEDFQEVCAQLGLNCSDLPHRNKSRRQDARAYYDEETRNIVGQLFEEEIEIFDYEFPRD
jgi:hypothetical protein